MNVFVCQGYKSAQGRAREILVDERTRAYWLESDEKSDFEPELAGCEIGEAGTERNRVKTEKVALPAYKKSSLRNAECVLKY